ncbi:MAG: LITAF-like zinc ribbon domain-containing protein [Ruminococcus sp.]
MVCPKCQSENVTIQAVAEQKKRSCLSVLLIIILICIPIIGWIGLFFLLRGKKSKTISYAVCQNCGNRWKI